MSRLADINSDESIVDRDNRARAERLAIKLARLKNIAVDIEEESRDHIPMLDDVDNSYEKTLGALSSGHKKVLTLLGANRKGRRLFCYTVLIFLAFLIFLFIWFGKHT